jgi:hypothetical protein
MTAVAQSSTGAALAPRAAVRRYRGERMHALCLAAREAIDLARHHRPDRTQGNRELLSDAPYPLTAAE